MKTLFVTITVCLLFNTAKAQSPILPIDNSIFTEAGAYYKDTNSDYDQFVGTWKYIDGSTSLTIKLRKVSMKYISNTRGACYYRDLLVGEYRYVENGVVKINTALSFNTVYSNPFKHNLAGGIIQKYNPNVPGICIGCLPGQVKVGLIFTEPGIDVPGSMFIYYFRHFTINGVDKLELTMRERGMPSPPVGEELPSHSIPFGTYFLTKIP